MHLPYLTFVVFVLIYFINGQMFGKVDKVSVGFFSFFLLLRLISFDKKNKYLFKDLKNSRIREGCFWKYCYWRSQATLNALDKILRVLENADRLIEANSELTQSFKKTIGKRKTNENENDEEIV